MDLAAIASRGLRTRHTAQPTHADVARKSVARARGGAGHVSRRWTVLCGAHASSVALCWVIVLLVRLALELLLLFALLGEFLLAFFV